MKKFFALVLSVGLFFASQAAYAGSIAVIDFNQGPSSSTATFAGSRSATIDLGSSAIVKNMERGQYRLNDNYSFMALNHDFIPEKTETKVFKPMSARFGLELRPHNLFYLAVLP